MKPARTFFERIRFSEATSPLAFLAALVLSFGLLIPFLGIYQDDWLFVYNMYARGAQGLWDFLYYDGTPFTSLINIALFSAMGFKPLYWHIGALLARWLTVTVFWHILKRLWPDASRKNFLAAMIFALHPFFTLQPLSYIFLHTWLGFFFLGLSFYWMILSVQDKKRFRLYLGLSLLAETATILTLEYFAGLEFLRPILLWMVLRADIKDPKERIIKALKLWIPYITIFGAYVYWRFFIYKVPIKDRNDPIVIATLLSNPLAGIQMIIFNLIPDMLLIVVASWYNALDPSSFDWSNRMNLYLTLLGAAAGLGMWFYLGRRGADDDGETANSSSWPREAFWVGLIVAVLGLIPPYVGGLFLNEKNPMWNSRFGMASMLGASMMLVAAVEALIYSRNARRIFFAILAGLAVGWHARYTNDFRGAWKKQANFYRQLTLRIPSLEPNTAIITDGEILVYMGDYPTAYAVNTMFAQSRGDSGEYIDYWFFSISSNFANRTEEFMNGMEMGARHRSVKFKGESGHSLIVSFEPEQGQCLYVIRPQDGEARVLPPLVRQASHLSDLGRIGSQKTSGAFLDEIGFAYPTDWCTFYQQADLARQNEDWRGVAKLWDAAHNDGFGPDAAFEYLPFIEAYARLGQWDKAAALTLEAGDAPPSSRMTLCDFWKTLPESSARDAALEKIQKELSCSQ